jgi:hypothetical protein
MDIPTLTGQKCSTAIPDPRNTNFQNYRRGER